MAYWSRSSVSNKKEPFMSFTVGGGVNTDKNAFEVDKEEATASLNTSSRLYPSLSVRPGTLAQYGSDTTALSGVNGATARAGTQFHVSEGTTWKYWNGSAYVNVATSLADAETTFLEFTTAADKFTVMFNGTEKKYWDGSSVANITDVNCPATKLIATNDNRMFALSGSIIRTSDIADITDWTNGDADAIGLYGMTGSGTALVIYNDMIIGWSDQTMHIVYGKTKNDFDPTEPIQVGCVSNKSTLINGQNGVLYWLDYNRIMAFTGGLPVEISQKVRGYLEDINYDYKEQVVSGQWNRYVYFSFPYNSSTTNNLTLEYDTERNTWYPYNEGFTDFFNIGQDLYGVDDSGVVKKMNQGTADDSTAITWSHTTGVMEPGPLKNLKYLTDVYAIVDLPTNSTLTLGYSTTFDNDDFATLHTFTADADEQNVRVRIPTTKLQRVNWFRLKLSGTGPCTVHYLETRGRVGD